MRRLACLALLAGLVLPAAAQPVDTVRASGVDVQRVRQRIGTIRGRRVVRVIQPVIVVGTPLARPAAAPAGSIVQVPTAEGAVPYRLQPDGTLVPLTPSTDVQRPPVEAAPAPIAAPAARLEAPRLPAVPPPLPPAQIAPAPVVRAVERVLLDTGLLRAVGLHFAFGQATLFAGEDRTLDAVGDVLTRHPELRLAIGGHTDAVGSVAFNQSLSTARAETVRRYLVERWNVAPERLTATGFGEAQPVAPNTGETGRALNRRVEFRVE